MAKPSKRRKSIPLSTWVEARQAAHSPGAMATANQAARLPGDARERFRARLLGGPQSSHAGGKNQFRHRVAEARFAGRHPVRLELVAGQKVLFPCERSHSAPVAGKSARRIAI